MSFDLYLQHFEAGEPARADKAAVLDVLRRQWPEIAHGDGWHDLEFGDGSSVEFDAEGLETDEEFTGCAFHFWSFGPAAIAFVHHVALAGDMVIFNAQGRNSAANPVMILTDPAQREQVSLKDYLPVLCTSADRLAALLGQGFGDWQAYRDRVLSEGGGS